jgi:hypothetical protein
MAACAPFPSGFAVSPTYAHHWKDAFAEAGEALLPNIEPPGTRVYRITRFDAWWSIQWIVALRVTPHGGEVRTRYLSSLPLWSGDLQLAPGSHHVRLSGSEANQLASTLDSARPCFVLGALGAHDAMDSDLWLFETVADSGYTYELTEWPIMPSQSAKDAIARLLTP